MKNDENKNIFGIAFENHGGIFIFIPILFINLQQTNQLI